LSRISDAFRSFFSIFFRGELPAEVAAAYGYRKQTAPAAAPKPAPRIASASDGAIQMIAILQRDSRLVDFLMEDISAYEDEQVGAAVRTLHDQCRDSLTRYARLSPVIDGVEGTYTKLDSVDPSQVKLLGNVPASGKVQGGTLRHKGWRAGKLDLPALAQSQDASIVAPAEIEVE
jgi:hypothetical protein